MSAYEYVHEEIELSDFHTLKIIADTDASSPFDWGSDEPDILHWHRRATIGDNPWSKYDMCIGIHDNRIHYVTADGDVPLDSIDDIADALRAQGAEVLPLYLYDHSGWRLSTREFSCRWDSGQVGFVVMHPDDIKREISLYRIDAKRRALLDQSRTCDNGLPIGNRGRKVWTEYLNTDTDTWTRDEVWYRRKLRITAADREKARERMSGWIKTLDQFYSGDVWGYVIEDEDGNQIESLWDCYGDDYCREEGLAAAKSLGLVPESHDEQHEAREREMAEEDEGMIASELGAAA